MGSPERHERGLDEDGRKITDDKDCSSQQSGHNGSASQRNRFTSIQMSAVENLFKGAGAHQEMIMQRNQVLGGVFNDYF